MFQYVRMAGVTFNNTEYAFDDILIVSGEVKWREKHGKEGHELYRSWHLIREEEVNALTVGDPDAILIGTGTDGRARIEVSVEEREDLKGRLFVADTFEVAKRYNELVSQGKKVNCLIHVTC
jgi:hypothetical protein